ncbi:MAG: AAA family ATPase [Deltaproteobacteria bacterium]|nr:MAG: AAA family ATPase [Deltaproteobacteria bacterium]
MSARSHLPWDDLFELHVVKKIGKLINRRWCLGLGAVSADGRDARPPRAPKGSARRGLADVIVDRPAGEVAAAANCRQVAARFRDAAAKRALRPGVVRFPSHSGLYWLAAPIAYDQSFLGALLCGAFALQEQNLREVDRAVAPLSLSPVDWAAARDAQPRLSPVEVDFLGDLVAAAAEEIAAHFGSVLARQRGTGDFEAEFAIRHAYGGLVGRSRAMQELYHLLDRVVASDSTVLIQGENGTGKELIARAIHYNSPRRNRRFVVQNCSAFNDNLLDSELFGHKKGAFTGAISDKQGLFEVADKGTFFLDEIGDMSPALQVKVLRVLQEGTFTAVGDTETRHVDVRIIAATNRDLKRMVETGEFREDLYYRINVINIVSPPLRERRDDIPLLIDHFLKRHAKGSRSRLKVLSDECMRRLVDYAWPGNVRELENEIERLVVLAGDERVIGEELLSPRIRDQSSDGIAIVPSSPHSLPDAVKALEKRMIYEALTRNNWNKTRAAAELNISRRNLIRLVQKYELERARA